MAFARARWGLFGRKLDFSGASFFCSIFFCCFRASRRSEGRLSLCFMQYDRLEFACVLLRICIPTKIHYRVMRGSFNYIFQIMVFSELLYWIDKMLLNHPFSETTPKSHLPQNNYDVRDPVKTSLLHYITPSEKKRTTYIKAL